MTNLFMFTVKANFAETFEVGAPITRVCEFFGELSSFSDLMPGVLSAHKDGKGIAHLTIEAEIPFVGMMRQKFSVEPVEESQDRVEWRPAATEKENFLRYTADFVQRTAGSTLVNFSQAVELRRNKARDLHTLAGFAGESLISGEMSRRFAEMARSFIEKARRRLES